MISNSLAIVESRSGNICIVALSGRIDSTNAEDLIARLKKLILNGEKSIVVDLGSVLFLTSVAFRAFLVITDEAERSAAKFVLCNVSGQVRELFELGGLIDAFTIYGSREEASTKLG
jgi:anti-anti-sigma factor